MEFNTALYSFWCSFSHPQIGNCVRSWLRRDACSLSPQRRLQASWCGVEATPRRLHMAGNLLQPYRLETIVSKYRLEITSLFLLVNQRSGSHGSKAVHRVSQAILENGTLETS